MLKRKKCSFRRKKVNIIIKFFSDIKVETNLESRSPELR